MDTQLKQLIEETFGEVFETMFFTFLEPINEMPGPAAFVGEDAYIQADISYHGPSAGRFSVYLPRRLAANITMNFLGVDDDEINPEQVLDTAKETVNMAVGSLLGKIDPAGESKLHIPSASELDRLELAEILEESGVLLFNSDYGPLWVVYEE
ncbi:MAG: chemotaxis protein CheX [Desulfurivibrio sp.]|nr:chemotaxis protein CheX [Desulfurivibrio sp.]